MLKLLFVLKIVTELRFWKFEVYFRTFTFKIFSTPKLSVRRCRAIQAVGIDIHGLTIFLGIQGFISMGLYIQG